IVVCVPTGRVANNEAPSVRSASAEYWSTSLQAAADSERLRGAWCSDMSLLCRMGNRWDSSNVLRPASYSRSEPTLSDAIDLENPYHRLFRGRRASGFQDRQSVV